MKKIIAKVLILSLGITLFSCEKDDDILNAPSKPIIVSLSNPETKLILDNSQFSWNKGDEISVFDFNTGNKVYKLESDPTKDPIEFIFNKGKNTVTALNAIYAVFPYNEKTSISTKGIIDYTIDQLYSYESAAEEKQLNNNIMVSKSFDKETRKVVFKNASAYLKLQLLGDKKISSISISGLNNEKLSGNVEININDPNNPIMTPSPDRTEGDNTIVVSTSYGSELSPTKQKDFYLAIIPTKFSKGIKVEITDITGKKMLKNLNTAIEFKRNTITPMTAIYFVPEDSDDSFVAKTAMGVYDLLGNRENLNYVYKENENMTVLQNSNSIFNFSIIDPFEDSYVRVSNLPAKFHNGQICEDVSIEPLTFTPTTGEAKVRLIVVKVEENKAWVKDLTNNVGYIIEY